MAHWFIEMLILWSVHDLVWQQLDRKSFMVYEDFDLAWYLIFFKASHNTKKKCIIHIIDNHQQCNYELFVVR